MNSRHYTSDAQKRRIIRLWKETDMTMAEIGREVQKNMRYVSRYLEEMELKNFRETKGKNHGAVAIRQG